MCSIMESVVSVNHAGSEMLHERARAVMTGGFTRINLFERPFPTYAHSGRGCRVVDVDGVERVDFLNNYFSLVHGYCFEPVQEAMRAQIELGVSFGMPTRSDVAFAELLCSRFPGLEEVRFTNSGSEAIITALKAARAYTGRPKVAKIEGAYHGLGDHVEVSLSSKPAEWGEDVPRAVAYARGTPSCILDDVVVFRFNDVAGLARALEQHRDTLAAILFDLVPSRAGMVVATPDFLAAVTDFCARSGALLVLDEIISSRFAYGGAQTLFDVKPDITVLGKIIGGGLPIGAIGGRREVMAVFDPSAGKAAVPHGGTFTANPLAMVAGMANMCALDRDSIERLNRLGSQLRRKLAGHLEASGLPGQITGYGSLFRIHPGRRIIQDYRTSYQDAAETAWIMSLRHGMFDDGYILTPNCSGALSTPMDEAEIDGFAEVFAWRLTKLA